jgi:hypothetical protein
VLYAVALVGLGWASSLFQLLPCLVLFGVGGNLTNISVNTQAVGVERLYKHKPIMASFHGLWSLAGFVAAAIGSFMIGRAVPPGVHFALIGLFIVAGLAVSAGYTVREDSNVDPNQPIFVKPDKELLGLGAIAFCALICEGAMFDWSGVYFKEIIKAGWGPSASFSLAACSRQRGSPLRCCCLRWPRRCWGFCWWGLARRRWCRWCTVRPESRSTCRPVWHWHQFPQLAFWDFCWARQLSA